MTLPMRNVSVENDETTDNVPHSPCRKSIGLLGKIAKQNTDVLQDNKDRSGSRSLE